MIIGIGCDAVEHHITTTLGWSSNSRMLQKILSMKEQQLYENQRTDQFLSGRFAAKEAVVKSLGTGMIDGIALPDIQILKNKRGAPVVLLKGKVKQIAQQLGITSWHLSITHTTSCSYAFVVAEHI